MLCSGNVWLGGSLTPPVTLSITLTVTLSITLHCTGVITLLGWIKGMQLMHVLTIGVR